MQIACCEHSSNAQLPHTKILIMVVTITEIYIRSKCPKNADGFNNIFLIDPALYFFYVIDITYLKKQTFEEKHS